MSWNLFIFANVNLKLRLDEKSDFPIVPQRVNLGNMLFNSSRGKACLFCIYVFDILHQVGLFEEC